jgi:hypothetical protein
VPGEAHQDDDPDQGALMSETTSQATDVTMTDAEQWYQDMADDYNAEAYGLIPDYNHGYDPRDADDAIEG